MATDPNSLLALARRALVRWLDVIPPPGTAWCVDCALNEGRTVVIAASAGTVPLLDAVQEHARCHPPDTRVVIRLAEPAKGEESS